MEKRHGHIRNPNFYRNRRTAKDLVEHFKYLNTDTRDRWRVDEDGACSESCEPFPMVKS